MGLSRREFLGLLAAGGAGVVYLEYFSGQSSWSRSRDLVFLFENFNPATHPKPEEQVEFATFIAASNRRLFKKIILPYPIHSIVQDPTDRFRLYGISKLKPTSAVIDLRKLDVIQTFEASENRNFYGHGQITFDGKHLLTSEQGHGEASGKIVMRDLVTLKIVREIDSLGPFPHEFRIIDSGETIIVSNRGPMLKTSTVNQSNLNWIRLGDEKLLKSHVFETGLSATHFKIDSRGWVIGGGFGPSVTGPGILFTISPAGECKFLTSPLKPLPSSDGEFAAISINESRGEVFAAGNESHMLHSWNYKTGEFLRSLPSRKTLGFDWLDGSGRLRSCTSTKPGFVEIGEIATVAELSVQRDERSIPIGVVLGPHLFRFSV